MVVVVVVVVVWVSCGWVFEGKEGFNRSREMPGNNKYRCIHFILNLMPCDDSTF